jgi:soluble lytic murein transglycosylase
MRKILLSFIFFSILLITLSYCAGNATMDRAVTLYKWKFYDDAVAELDKLISDKKEPWTSRALFLKANCLTKKGDSSGAEGILKALADDPKFALSDYAEFYLGEIGFNGKHYDEAMVYYGKIPQNSALRTDAAIRKAECLYDAGKFAEAIDICNSLISENPSLASMDKARLVLGQCYEKTGKPKEAVKAYHEIDTYTPLSPLVKEAVLNIKRISGRYKIYPDAATAEEIFNKAQIYYSSGDFHAAGDTYQRIVTNYRSSDVWEEALYKLGLCDYKRRRLTSSIQRLKTCVAQGGDYAAAAQFYMAFAYGKAGYFYQALDSLGKVVSNYPASDYADDAAYYLGYYYEVNNYKDTALEYYSRFVQQFPKSEFLDDGYWKIGKLYYFRKDYAKAREAFSKALMSCESGDWLDACSYWKALAEEKMGNKLDAISSYKLVASRFDHTYYSYRARERLVSLGAEVPDLKKEKVDESAANMISEGPFAYTSFPEDQTFVEEGLPLDEADEDHITTMEALPAKGMDPAEHFKKYTELMAVGFYEEAAKEAAVLVSISPPHKKMSAKLALATANLGAGEIKDSIVYAEALCNNAIMYGTSSDLPVSLWRLAYPKGYYKYVSQYANEYGVDEALVLAVIREESRFNPKTLSSAKARGLMQIIPSTGLSLARLIGIRPYYTNRLHEPDANIRMGCAYLAQLMKRFDNDMVMVLAAYNGGPVRVQKWKNKWLKEPGSEIDIDEFVESIPLQETRRYVQKVMKSYYEYKRHYTQGLPPVPVKG